MLPSAPIRIAAAHGFHSTAGLIPGVGLIALFSRPMDPGSSR